MKKEVVLYVEDEEENWKVTALRLRRHYDLRWARNAEEACRIVRQQHASLYAILMDIQLKGSALDGIGLTKLFKGKLTGPRPAFATDIGVHDIPVIFVTAYASRYEEGLLEETGAERLVSKPVDFTELNLALANVHLSRLSRRLDPGKK